MARDDHGRKAGRNFASLRATFSRSTVTVNEVPLKEDVKKPTIPPVQQQPAHDELKPPPVQPSPPVPKNNKVLERRQSKYTLFDLFSKPKVQTLRGYHESGLEPLPEQPPAPKQDRTKKAAVDRAESVRNRNAASPLLPAYTPLAPNSRETDDWEPLPLFQAFPQAIRHGTLQCPSISMDSLVRTQNLRKQAGFLGNAASLPSVRENVDGDVAQELAKSVSRRYSVMNETPELIDRVFVLVSAGRLVQYAGDGNYDRMPEKVLQLGEKSAAFACDLIPGKHWVVQVVQQVTTDASGQISKSRSILSRFRNPTAGRKAASSVLLVFSSAEDMDGWLKAIRGVIEGLGGAKRKYDGEARVLEEKKNPVPAADSEQQSQRYKASRPPSTISTASVRRPRSNSSFSQPRSPRSPTVPDEESLPPMPSSTHLSPHSTPSNSPRDAQFPQEAQSLLGTTADNSPREASVASSDQMRLDKLREGSRTSIISVRTSRTSETENLTMPTSKCSSSPPSPHGESFAEQQTNMSTKPVRISYIAPSPVMSRPSVQPATPVEIPPVEMPPKSPQPVVAEITQGIAEVVESKPIEPQPLETPATVLDNPRARTSQTYSHTLPARLYTAEKAWRMSSDLMEPWTKTSRPDSVVGQLPTISTRSLSRLDSVSKPRRPLSRMLPVRPSDPGPTTQTNNSGTGTTFQPRRYSSLPSRASIISNSSRQSPPLSSFDRRTSTSTHSSAGSVDRSSRTPTPPTTHRPRVPSLPLPINPTPSPPQQHTSAAQPIRALRRPTSLQIRSDPAPFLSQRRPSMTMRNSQPATTVVSNSYFAGSTPMNDFLPMRAASVAARPSYLIDPEEEKEKEMEMAMEKEKEKEKEQEKEQEKERETKPVLPEPIAIPIPMAITTSIAVALPAPSNAPPQSPIAPPPPIPPMNPNRHVVRARSSMSAMMMRMPPAPPPNMPLPSLPPALSPPPNMPLPSLPPALSPPPNMPLPPLPSGMMSNLSPSPSGRLPALPSLPPSGPLPPLPAMPSLNGMMSGQRAMAL